jgi:hypothetical protein
VDIKGHCLNLKVFWSKTELHEDPNRPGIYVAHQELPEVGWKAFFVDVTYGPFSVVENRLMKAERKLEAIEENVSWPIDWP